jgi:small subunit ribosomal protein S12
MPTINQLVRRGRPGKQKKDRTPALDGCPQKKGIILKAYTVDPKKPNSAKRKVCRVKLSNKKVVVAYIPGEGHSLNEHDAVLVRGGRVRDLPGMKYKVVRGARNSADKGEVRPHRSRCSKYGVKKKNLKEVTTIA